jgi:hypothetical protein
MLTNRCTQTLGMQYIPLAMLDFVARPQPLSVFFSTGRQWRWKALPLQLAFLCAIAPVATGCKGAAPSSAPSRAEVRQERQAQQSKMDAARQQLEEIPPPSKNRYLSVRTKEAYANPFLVVHPQTITVTIIFREASCGRPKPASRKSMCGRATCPRPWLPCRPTYGLMAGWLRLRSHPPPPGPSGSPSAAM